MQVIFLPSYLSVVLCFLLWGGFQVFFSLLCTRLPAKFFRYDGKYFSSREWEAQGEIYDKVFKIRRWKGHLPDGSAITNVGMKKKHMEDYSREGITAFLQDSCRAELSHMLAILPFPLFGLFCPPAVVPIMLFYAVLVNLPCVFAQRFNRPRLVRILKRLPENLSE